jgi:hypothetical protein
MGNPSLPENASDYELFRQLFVEFSRLSALIRLRTENLFEPLDSPLLALECASEAQTQEASRQDLAEVGNQLPTSSARTSKSELSDLR